MSYSGTYQPFHKTILTLRRAKCGLCEMKYLIDDINGFLETQYVDSWRVSAFGYWNNHLDNSWEWYRSPCCRSIMQRTRFIFGERFKTFKPFI